MHTDPADSSSSRHGSLAPLRTHLVALIVLAALPLAALAWWQILADLRSEQVQLEANLARSAAALSQAVDNELLASIDALATLAHDEVLRTAPPAQVRRYLQARPRPRRDWSSIFLLDATGRPLLDTEPAAPDAPDLAALHGRVLVDQQPVVARLDAATAGASVLLGVPVLAQGQLRFVVGARIADAAWQRLAGAANRPDGGYALVYDAQRRLIAWTLNAGPPDTMLPAAQQELLGHRPFGVQRTEGVEGKATYTAWQTVPSAAWGVQVGVPAAPVDAAHRRALAAALSTGCGSLLLGLLLATLAARRVTRPLHLLATRGHAGPGPIAVLEVAMLRDALRAAAENDARARREMERDITERKRVERELLAAHAAVQDQQRLIDLAQQAGQVGFLRHDFATDTLVWTPGHCKLFGIDALPAGSGLQAWFDRIAPDDRPRVQETLAAACTERTGAVTLEYGVPRERTGTRWLSSRLLLRFDAGGRPAELAGASVDMTDQRESELRRAELTEQALAARQAAEAASKAKDEFLSMLGHELRNPLGAISAAVDVLDGSDSHPDAGAAEAREIIARQTRNLAHMMNDLLDVGRVIAGKTVLSREPVNLAAVATRVRDTLEFTHRTGAHALRLDVRDAWVSGDAVRLEQVVVNLVGNAIKYTPAGRAIVLRVDVRGGEAVLEVQDAGTGIPAALLPHIFDLFVQGERSLDRRAGGLGIGLTLVRRLVELHGGSVAVATEAAGSRFTVRLPAIAAPARSSEEALPPSRRRRVLVVEDNADVLKALRSKLELDGHTVSTAADGIEGLSRLLRLQPEVSIVDIGLPGLTGYEVARHARAAGYAGRMIALSGYGQPRDADDAMVAGFDAYLVKPVERMQLRASLSD